MANLVASTLEYTARQFNANAQTVWEVKFIDGEYRVGTITDIDTDAFALEQGNGNTYYFDSAKVIFLRIR